MGDPTERDWKHMKTIHDRLLNRLCARINAQAKTIIDDGDTPDHKKYLVLYKHIQGADDVIARCFNDWRRSRILMRIVEIKRENLFTPEEFEGLSEDLRRTIIPLEEIR
jgi:hypothetical protein